MLEAWGKFVLEQNCRNADAHRAERCAIQLKGYRDVIHCIRAVNKAELIAETRTSQNLEIRARTQDLSVQLGIAVQHGPSRGSHNSGVIDNRNIPYRRVQHVVKVRIFLEVVLNRQLYGLAVVGIDAGAAQVGHGVAGRVNKLLREEL